MKRYGSWIGGFMVTALMVGALLASDATAFGPQGHGYEGFGPGPGLFHGMEKILELKLTVEQQEKISNIITAYRPEFRQAFKAYREARKEMKTVMARDTFDEAAVRAAHQAVASATEELAVLRARMRHELASVLTKEQREKMQSWHEEDEGDENGSGHEGDENS